MRSVPTLSGYINAATAIYLGLPLVVFLLTWLQLPYGIPLALLFVGGSWLAFRSPGALGEPQPALQLTRLHWLGIASIALFWSALGGVGELFYANIFDWHVRGTLMLDMAKHMGPIAFQYARDPAIWLLRCPLGYYLVPALASNWLGVQFAPLLLLLWTFIGVFLLLAQLAVRLQTPKKVGLMLVIVPFFSGMDWLGGWLLAHPAPLFSVDHIQWWALLFQYSSNSTLLFWVPNHTLPGWLFAAFIYANWQRSTALRTVPFWIAAVPLWSPLTAVGVLPILLAYMVKHLRKPADIKVMLPIGLLILPAALVSAIYLVMDSSRIPLGAGELGLPFAVHARLYLAFVFMQFGLLWLLLLRLRKDSLLINAGLFLFILPLFHMGASNDLVMRASIPALFIVCLAAIERLGNINWQNQQQKPLGVVLVLMLLIGVITPMHEIARALLYPRWHTPINASVFVETSGAPHYFAQMTSPILATMLATAELQHIPANARPYFGRGAVSGH